MKLQENSMEKKTKTKPSFSLKDKTKKKKFLR